MPSTEPFKRPQLLPVALAALCRSGSISQLIVREPESQDWRGRRQSVSLDADVIMRSLLHLLLAIYSLRWCLELRARNLSSASDLPPGSSQLINPEDLLNLLQSGPEKSLWC